MNESSDRTVRSSRRRRARERADAARKAADYRAMSPATQGTSEAPRPIVARVDVPPMPNEWIAYDTSPPREFIDEIRWSADDDEFVVTSRRLVRQKHGGTSSWSTIPHNITLRESIARGNARHRMIVEAAIAHVEQTWIDDDDDNISGDDVVRALRVLL